MGTSCTGCALDKNTASIDQARIALPSKKAIGSQPSDSNCDAMIMRVRASNAKDGGFALKNFSLSNKGKIEDFYSVQEVVGEGAFGSVRRAEDSRTQQPVAVKSIPKRLVNEEQLELELEIMSSLDHPNIVRLLGGFEDAQRVYLIMELCEGGELFDRVAASGNFTEGDAAYIMRQSMLAVNYLHQHMIIHRDLKPQNFLLSRRCALANATVKLIDFGISRRFQVDQVLSSKKGTPTYLAPEVLAGGYTFKADLWSLGVIMYSMISGTAPFKGDTVTIFAQIKAAEIEMTGTPWDTLTEDACTFLRGLLTKDPAFRLSADEALRHPWLEDRVGSPKDGKKKKERKISKLEVQRVEAYSHMHSLKKATLTVIVTQLDPKAIKGLKNTFVNMDKNNDGVVSASELKEGLLLAGVAIPDNLEELYSQIDTDGSGVVNYTEFLASTLDKKLYHQEDVVWAAFKKFDMDGSGGIDIKELVNVLGSPDVQQALHLDGAMKVEELFSMVDKNRDGKIDFNEFFAMLQANHNEAAITQHRQSSLGIQGLGCGTCLSMSLSGSKEVVPTPPSQAPLVK